jgi:hypothetical protein
VLADDLLANPDYRALVAHGWRLRGSYQARGAYTVLLGSVRAPIRPTALRLGPSSTGTPGR